MYYHFSSNELKFIDEYENLVMYAQTLEILNDSLTEKAIKDLKEIKKYLSDKLDKYLMLSNEL